MLALVLSACSTKQPTKAPEAPSYDNATEIVLSDSGITVDGVTAGTDKSAAVYTANDIVYYEAGKDFTYGEGSEADAHTVEEAAAHTVVHITQPGTYSLRGQLSRGQVAVDLGDDAKKDPEAVAVLVLNGVDITCEVAPAVIFYNVYECETNDAETATKDVDTSAAGANVIIADDTTNKVNGSYVARIYKPDSVVLNEDGTAVEDASKLHKYDGAFYSKRSMNIFGEKKNTGTLHIKAANEGLDSECHLTINGGNIHIESGNDGINTNEDGVSVTTVNNGMLTVKVTGETGEGDGIDSNGWLIINGGTVIAQACSNSADAGIDSDMGIHINGGTVLATGNMLDRIEDGSQKCALFTLSQKMNGGETVTVKNEKNKQVYEAAPENAYSILIYSSSDLKDETYTLWNGDTQLATGSDGMMGGPGMGPGGMERPEMLEGMEPPEGFTPPENGEFPEGFEPPQDGQPPEGFTPPEDGKFPEGFTPPQDGQPPEGFTPPEGGQPPQKPDGNRPAGTAQPKRG